MFFLVFLPYLLLCRFKNKREGFFILTLCIVAIQLFIALITQAFGIGLYSVVVGLNVLVGLACVIIFFKSHWKSFVRQHYTFQWYVPIFFVLIFSCLFSVHYNYSGAVSQVLGRSQVVSMQYPYPYFSDEWLGVALANYSITSHHLPLVNPLLPNTPYEYFVFGFYSLLAELFLLMGFQPLLYYAAFALAAGFAVCFLVYQVLRAYEVSPLGAILSAVGMLYVVNGANLPGLWYLLPFNAGFIVFLIMLGLMAYRCSGFAVFAAVLSFILYPPLIVFIAPAFLGYLYRISHLEWRMVAKSAGIFLLAALAILVVGWLSLSKASFASSFHSAWILVVRGASDGGIVSFPLWVIVPFPFYLLVLYAFYLKWKSCPEMLYPILVGLLFWSVYAYSLSVFVIDYSRIAAITSWLIVLAAGFAIDPLIAFSSKYPKSKNAAIAFLLFFFLVSMLFYTDGQRWKNLTLFIPNKGENITVNPAAPASQYLTNEDLLLFQGITRQYFLAPSWKGLVIGAATDNYPLDSKESTIANHILNYDQFSAASCVQKYAMVQKRHIPYVYSTPFTCDFFTPIGQSSEGLVLYNVRL